MQLTTRNLWLSAIITAVSNISIQYNFSSISIALLMMSTSECTTNTADCMQGTQQEWIQSTASATIFIGAILGQLTMGYAGDIYGRNQAMLFTLTLASVAAFASSIISFGSPTSVYSIIIICRFLLGIGVGGVYPLSATKAAEDGENSEGELDIKGAARAFFWQAPGSMVPWIIAYIFTFTSMSTELKWRLLLGLGCIPGIIVAICYRLSVADEPFEPTNKIEGEKSNIWMLLQDRRIVKNLIMTGGTWFLYDVCYYGVNLFGGEIVASITSNDDDDISSNHAIRVVTSQNLIALSTSIPATLGTILLMKYFTVKSLQIWGFILIAICFILLASCFHTLKESNPNALYFLYCLLLFSLSTGPNVTTFILPPDSFPKNVRTTCNGIASACGKLGAVLGAYVYGSIADATSYVFVMIICAILAIIGAIVSQILIEEKYQRKDIDIDNKYLLSNI